MPLQTEHHPNCVVFDSRAATSLLTVLRNKDTPATTFALYADRISRMIGEEALALLATPATVTTPCGTFDGLLPPSHDDLCLVSVMRSGDILLDSIRKLCVGVPVGKILLQRDESDPLKRAKLFYCKLPPDIARRRVVLADPMLATGGSAKAAIDSLLAVGVKPENILFVNIIACPEGLKDLYASWPQIRVLTAAIDSHLNEHKFIVPGLGDFGDRYYCT
eukprot:TRINITY_DN1265_c0_g1_i1.p2 TRINITY_DN1265_c0_g1~~TRINITY_DN1265_c0_g1_i1.p2  ORF type:complete len:220 (+),score=52.84 TRINITY_DN1265_c0_g1_i1:40-699(+)